MFSFAKSLRVAEIYRSPMLDHPLKHLICFLVDFLFVPSFSSNTYAVDGLLLMFHFHSELSSAKTVYIVTDVLKVSGMTFAVSGDGGRVMFQNLNSHFPVRTAHNKFRLRTDGCVCEAVGTCKCCQSVLNYSTNSQMDSGIRMETKWRILTDQLTPYLNLLPRNPGRPGLSNQRQQRASVFIHRANYNFLTSDHLFVVKFLTFTFPSLSFFKINAWNLIFSKELWFILLNIKRL